MEPDSSQDIVVGSGGIQPKKPVPLRRRKKLIYTSAAVLAVLVLGVVAYQIFHKPERISIICTQEQPDDYDVMTERNIYCRLKQETGLDIRDLMDSGIHSWTFKSFNEAAISARALYGMGKYDEKGYSKALAAYKIAESKGMDDELNADFYQRYALAALTAKDQGLYERLTEKQRTAIENDASLSPAAKQEKLDEIDGQNRILENAEN